MKIFKDYIDEICDFYRNNGVEIDPVPSIKTDDTESYIFDPYISTGNYNP